MLPDRNDQRAMRAVALLRRVGWHGDLAQEGQIVCEFLGLDWNDTQDRIQQIEDERGLIARQGRYRYVTPHLLAVWLASETWRQRGSEKTWSLRSKLPDPLSRRAFEERIQDIGAEPDTRELAAMLLGPSGLFPTLSALEEPGSGRVLRLLTMTDPEAGLEALRRLILCSSPEELSQLVDARHDVIWSLEALAWRPEFFRDAAEVLLELAVNEDRQSQPIGPHATDAWRTLFQVHLGGTATSVFERLSLARELLQDPDERKRLLAVSALSKLFAWNEHRTQGVDRLGGAPLPREWQPRDDQERIEVRRAGLALLDEATRNDLPIVRQAAEGVLLNIGRAAVRSALAEDYLDRVERLPREDPAARRELREVLETILRFEHRLLTEGHKQRIRTLCERLAGSSFRDRLRRLIGMRTTGDRIDHRLGLEEETRIRREQAGALVSEALAHPDLSEAEWDWLFSAEALEAYFFAWALGERDVDLRWWPFVEDQAARRRRSPTFATAYLRGQIESGRLQREEVLDRWMSEGEAMALAIYDVIWRDKLTDPDVERLTTLISRGWLDGGHVGGLYPGRAFLSVSLPTASRLLQATLDSGTPAATDAATALVYLRMHEHPEERDALEALAWAALERSDGFASRGRDTMAAYYAEHIGEMLAERDPLRAAELVLPLFDTDDAQFIGSDSRLQVLCKAIAADPERVWERVAPRLYPKEASAGDPAYLRAFELRLALEKWFPALIPAEILLRWAEANAPEGPRHLPAWQMLARLP